MQLASNPNPFFRRRRSNWPANLWLVPSVAVALCIVLFLICQRIDRAQFTGAIQLPPWLDQGGATDALALLAATAGGIITTLGLVLSIAVVVFTLVTSQFGQRLLREFMRDRGTQLTIGVFAATFVFNLLTMLSVTARQDQREFVPWVSIWVSLALAMSCMGMLIFYINHVAVEIQVGAVIEHIAADFRYSVTEQLSLAAVQSIDFPSVTLELPVQESGYLQRIDYPTVAKAAADAGATVRFVARPGVFLMEGSPIAEAAPDHVDQDRDVLAATLNAAIARAITLGDRRTLAQDPEFALAQMTEVAERAMSPALNDPNTLFTCLEWVGDCLRVLVQAPRRDIVHRDADGRIRLVESPMRFDDVVANAFAPLRHVSSDSAQATVRMLNTIAALAPFMGAEHTVPLAAEADLIRNGFHDGETSRDANDVDVAHRRAITALQTRLTIHRA